MLDASNPKKNFTMIEIILFQIKKIFVSIFLFCVLMLKRRTKEEMDYQQFKGFVQQMESLFVEQKFEKNIPLAYLTLTIKQEVHRVEIHDFTKQYEICKFWFLRFVYAHGNGMYTIIITKEVEANFKEEYENLEKQTRMLCQESNANFNDILAAIPKLQNLKESKKFKSLVFKESFNCNNAAKSDSTRIFGSDDDHTTNVQVQISLISN